MSSAVEEHVIYRIANAPMRDHPFPHMFVKNVFPTDFYAQMRANWPDSAALTSLADTGRVSKGAYAERFVLPLTPSGIEKLPQDRRAFWAEFGSWFMADRFLETMIKKFEVHTHHRFGDERKFFRFEADSLLVRDTTNFSIGPHSDAPHRLLSILFYCPDDASMSHLGTSIYVPLDPDFRCKGGPHYSYRKFQKVMTMEYMPNCLFAFFKTDSSFHGVEPIRDEHVQRDLLLYDVRVVKAREDHAANNAGRPSGVGLTMLRKLFAGMRS